MAAHPSARPPAALNSASILWASLWAPYRQHGIAQHGGWRRQRQARRGSSSIN